MARRCDILCPVFTGATNRQLVRNLPLGQHVRMAKLRSLRQLSGGLIAGISAFVLTAAGTTRADPRTVVFPGPIRSVSAPGGSGARIFYRPHMSRDAGQEHPVFYEDGQGHFTRVATVTRSMGVKWSPDGRHAFLQDNFGSNRADCYVLSRTARSIRGVSLFKIVQRTPGHPTRSEEPSVSHYYVHCDLWLSSYQLAGAVSGHTDANPSHDFDHRFVYDLMAKRLRWRR